MPKPKKAATPKSEAAQSGSSEMDQETTPRKKRSLYNVPDPNMTPEKMVLRQMLRATYKIQGLRVAVGNGLCGTFRSRLGLAPAQLEDEDEDAKKVLEELRASFKKITDGIVKEIPAEAKFKGDGIITTYSELKLVSLYMGLEKMEEAHFRQLGGMLEQFPLYTTFLKGVVGCGPATSAIIISEIDIHKARYVSSLWKYAGFDVAPDGFGRSSRKEHQRVIEYIDSDGKPATRMGLTHKRFLKSKLWLLAANFVRCDNEKYRKIYNDYRHRLDHRTEERWVKASKLHKRNAALRVAAKMFLAELYNVWRKLEGLEVFPPYSEAKLGLIHRGGEGSDEFSDFPKGVE